MTDSQQIRGTHQSKHNNGSRKQYKGQRQNARAHQSQTARQYQEH